MGETISQLEHELAGKHGELGRSLNELHTKTRELTDWRRFYRDHHAPLLGAALAGGVVLGIVAGRGVSSGRANVWGSGDNVPRLRSRAVSRLEADWRDMSDALLGVASAKVMELVGDLVPGFHDQLNKNAISDR